MPAGRAWRRLRKGSVLYRIHRQGRDPLWFGPAEGEPARHRFDSPDGAFRVCYLALGLAGAFVEAFLRDPDRMDGIPRILAASELRARRSVRVRLTRDLEVASLRGRGLQWHGVTAHVSSSPLYAETQALAARIHAHPRALAGLQYRCRHDDDQLAVAIFDRARDGLEVDARSSGSCLVLARLLEGAYPFVVDPDR